MSSVYVQCALHEELWAAKEWLYTDKFINIGHVSEGVSAINGYQKNLLKLYCYRSILKFWW